MERKGTCGPLVPGVQSCGEKPVSKMGHIPEVTRYQVRME